MAGDADKLADGNTLSVGLTTVDTKRIDALRLLPAVFTPNGDGVNDETLIQFALLNLDGSVSVDIEFFELSGRRLGKFSTAWDGRVQGSVLPPGFYILQLKVDTDRGIETRQKLLLIVY